MKKYFFVSFAAALLAASSPSSLLALKNESIFSPKKEDEARIFVNNRILAQVNGKAISTFDLMKKMDLAFYRQYPQYASSNEARIQFYDASWKHILGEIIDKELVLADAAESKIEVSNGDIRQEIELSFGPNVIANLDKAGLSFDEAAKIMQEDIILQRLLAGRVHSKALRQVTPAKVRVSYEEFIQDPANARLTQWSYRIITLTERTLQRSEDAAKAAYQLLLQGISPDKISTGLKEMKVLGRKGKVTVSKPLKHNDKEISKEYQDILMNLEEGMFSQPFAQMSRAKNATVYRILILEEKIPGGIPSYREMGNILKEKLMDREIDKETDNYLLKLRQHYHIRQEDIDSSLPPDYKPFILKNPPRGQFSLQGE